MTYNKKILEAMAKAGLTPPKESKQRHSVRHLESRLQQMCVEWFRSQPRWKDLWLQLFAVPNGGARTQRKYYDRYGRLHQYSPEAVQMKGEGVTAGVSDLLLLTPRHGFGCLCIEMKIKSSASRQRDTQKVWQASTENAGNKYVVCRTFEEFCKVVTEYLSE